MGKLLEEWGQKTERWQSEMPNTQKLLEMKAQIKGRGWPVEFYTRPAAKNGFAPVQLASSCARHNPKDNPEGKTTRGVAFVKGLEGEQVVVGRGDTEFKVRMGDLLGFQPVLVHREGQTPLRFLLPLEERPVYLDNGRLYALVESNDLYAFLSVGVDGPWEIALPPEQSLASFLDVQQEVPCPKGEAPVEKPWFEKTYCRKLWDKGAGKAVTAQFFWACQ